MTDQPAYVVLGGAGRLGQRLLPLLEPTAGALVALSRQPRRSGRVEWVTTDLTAGPCCQQAVVDLLGGASSVTLVDLVLDRSGVTAMRRSIASATMFAGALHRRLRQAGTVSRIVVASTTAALAPLGLRTPYGIAKYRQARRYAYEQTVDLVLLPQLGAAAQRTFVEAARALADVIAAAPAEGRLWVMRPPTTQVRLRDPISRLPHALLLSLLARTIRRDDPSTSRMATHAWLAQMPPSLRARLDHHHAPPCLMQRFEKRLGLPAAMPLNMEEDHGPT